MASAAEAEVAASATEAAALAAEAAATGVGATVVEAAEGDRAATTTGKYFNFNSMSIFISILCAYTQYAASGTGLVVRIKIL